MALMLKRTKRQNRNYGRVVRKNGCKYDADYKADDYLHDERNFVEILARGLLDIIGCSNKLDLTLCLNGA